jgi:hypothetical protein
MNLKSGSSVSLKSQAGLQLWKTYDGQDINRAWENFVYKDNIKT